MKFVLICLLSLFSSISYSTQIDENFEMYDKDRSQELDYYELLTFYNKNYPTISSYLKSEVPNYEDRFSLSLFYYSIINKVELSKIQINGKFYVFDICLKKKFCRYKNLNINIKKESFDSFIEQIKK